ncbi:DNA-3-methyladenine glycosylase [Clostridium intestinale]|uniref:DNA-3-methyladenine glycosylase n=1 Tax=Clostridium intestinale TaxID=36845 RepID=UPI002DD62234|nr:DNA-3-methyladenine glycosylase [Clostridium intestinale]WRY50356.1 DNA-3-methyladenine glycosylase [Clostridium intestinale]
MRLERDFFARDTLIVAKELLGKVIVREIDGVRLSGKIVETEGYIGSIDKASHAYGGKKTPRVEPLYGEPGISYVFSIYGMYECFNVISKEKGSPEGILIRAVEPIDGLEKIAQNRFRKSYDTLTAKEMKNLTNGPSKLCIALDINKKAHNFMDLVISKELYIEDGDIINSSDIVETTRIGIDYAEEAVDFPWRFYVKNNIYVSKK